HRGCFRDEPRVATSLSLHESTCRLVFRGRHISGEKTSKTSIERDRRLQGRISLRFVTCLLEQPRRSGPAVVVVPRPTQALQGHGANDAVREIGEEAFEQGPRAGSVACIQPKLGGRDRTSSASLPLMAGREPSGILG